jgi:hypothetical protein
MTMPVEGGTPEVQPTEGQGQGDAAGQYAGYLKDIPEQFHGQLLDGFKQTDRHWQSKLEEAQSQYKPYETLSQRYEPQYLTAAAAMLDQIQQNPNEVIPWLAQEFGLQLGSQAQAQQGQGGQTQQWGQDQAQTDLAGLPPEVVERINRVEQLAELTGRTIMEQQEQQRVQEELAQFDQYLGDLKTKHGDYDQDWVLAKVASGEFDDPEKAVLAYKTWEQSVIAAANQRRLPGIMSASGGSPSNQVDVTNLNPQDTRNLVAQMIQAAQSQG